MEKIVFIILGVLGVVVTVFLLITRRIKPSAIPDVLHAPESEEAHNTKEDERETTTFEGLLDEITGDLPPASGNDFQIPELEDTEPERTEFETSTQQGISYEQFQGEMGAVQASIQELEKRIQQAEAERGQRAKKRNMYRQMLSEPEGAKTAFVASEIFKRKFEE